MGMKTIDVAIILGGGTDGTLTPMLYTKERLEGFIAQGEKFGSVPIIVSGGYSASLDKRPKYLEADVMKKFLIVAGFSARVIYLEKRSRDTIGNAYYSKQIVKKHPRWKNILVVTTTGHIPRSRWIFKKVFGPKYNFEYLGVPSRYVTFASNPGREKYEAYVIATYAEILFLAKDGDDRKIFKILKATHPAYSKNKRSQELKEKIMEAKQKLLG
jgi:uncharacterized SAM-binding protein YcdF (DUF218 family)